VKPKVRVALAVIGVLLLLLFAWKFSYILAYLLIAGVLSLMGAPVMRFLSKISIGKFRLNRAFRSILTILFFYAVIAGFFALFAPMLLEQGKVLTQIDWPQLGQSIEEPLNNSLEYLKDKDILDEDFNVADVARDQANNFFKIDKIQGLIGGTIGGITTTLAGLFAVTFILFFFLKEENLFYNIILGLTPDRIESRVMGILGKVENLLSRYVLGIALQVALFTLVVFIGLKLIDVENALLIAFIAGIFNLIPYVGPALGAIFAAIILLSSTFTGTFDASIGPNLIRLVIVFGVAQTIDNVLFQPYIFSNSVKAHPLEIFIVILVAGTLGGIVGMLIAIPVYTILRVVAKEFLSEFKPIRQLTKNV